MRASHPSPIGSTACAPRFPVFQIAPVASSRRSRRGGGRVRSAALLLLEFRSAAVGAASLIVGAVLGGTMRLGARVQRVFAAMKEVVLSLVHARQIGMESVGDVREVVGEFRRV